ncbi:MAG: hypothetical protein NVS4B7_09000 [Ktedonobacteraceae bacterium]
MSTNIDQTSNDLPIVCSLAEQDLVKRRAELAVDIFKNVQQVQELADGYAFRYPGAVAWATKLTEFITFERACCPFFTFELIFEPEQGPIWLRLRGGEGVKEFIQQEMGG